MQQPHHPPQSSPQAPSPQHYQQMQPQQQQQPQAMYQHVQQQPQQQHYQQQPVAYQPQPQPMHHQQQHPAAYQPQPQVAMDQQRVAYQQPHPHQQQLQPQQQQHYYYTQPQQPPMQQQHHVQQQQPVYQQPVHQVIVQQQPQAVQQQQPQPQPRGAVPAQRFQQQQAPPQQQQYRGPQPQQQQGQQVVRLQNASPVIFGRVQGSVGGQRQIIRTPAGQIVRVQNQQNLLLNDGIQQTMTPQTWIPIHKPHNMVVQLQQSSPMKVLPVRSQGVPQQQQQQQVRYVSQAPARVAPGQQQWRQSVRPPPQPQSQRTVLRPQQPQAQTQSQQQYVQRPAAPPQPQTPLGGDPEIQYGVEHIFEENGKEVRKMPLLVQGQTMWVETVPGGGGKAQEQSGAASGATGAVIDDANSFSIPLDDLAPGPPAPTATRVEQPAAVAAAAAPVETAAADDFEPPQQRVKKASDYSDQERSNAIRQVMEEGLSPGVVGSMMGVGPEVVRKWVRQAGHNLPTSYKVKLGQPKKSEAPAPPVQVASAAAAQPQSLQQQQQQQVPQQQPVAGPRMPGVTTYVIQQQQQLQQQRAAAAPQPPPQRFASRPAGVAPRPSPPTPGVVPQPGPKPTKKVVATDAYKPRLIPGFLVLCKNCGATGNDFNCCERCRKPIPETAKRIPDQNAKFSSARLLESSAALTVTSGGDLRGVRLPTKPRKKKLDEPECIAISSDEDEGDEDEEGAAVAQGGGKEADSQEDAVAAAGGDAATAAEKGSEVGAEKGGSAAKEGEAASAGAAPTGAEGAAESGAAPDSSQAQGSASAAAATAAPTDGQQQQQQQGQTAATEKKEAKTQDMDPCLLPPSVPDEHILNGKKQGQWFSILTRSVRLGSYKVLARESTLFTATGIQITIPDRFRGTKDRINVNVKHTDVTSMSVHLGKAIPIIFIYLSPGACAAIRKQLRMDRSYGIWLDILAEEETFRRLTILPDKVPDEAKTILRSQYPTGLEELDSKSANEILVKSSPKDYVQSKIVQQVQDLQNKAKGSSGSAATPLTKLPMTAKLCQFPPSGGSVTVTHEDYTCLADESFLNDTIIEFYFKWLQCEVMSEKDRNRTHFFTTYFYNKLTKRPVRNRNKIHPVEDNQNLTSAEKRYDRVKRWTKKVNIFEKDFVVIPINEHSHWFLAVICFPGQSDVLRADTGDPTDQPETQKRLAQKRLDRGRGGAKSGRHQNKRMLQIGSTSIIPIKGADNRYRLDESDFYDSDRDEADASDNEMLLEDADYYRIANAVSREKKSVAPAPKKADKNQEADTEKKAVEEKSEKEDGGKKAEEASAKAEEKTSSAKPEEKSEKEEGENKAAEAGAKKEDEEPDLNMEVDEGSQDEQEEDAEESEKKARKDGQQVEEEEEMREGELKLEMSEGEEDSKQGKEEKMEVDKQTAEDKPAVEDFVKEEKEVKTEEVADTSSAAKSQEEGTKEGVVKEEKMEVDGTDDTSAEQHEKSETNVPDKGPSPVKEEPKTEGGDERQAEKEEQNSGNKEEEVKPKEGDEAEKKEDVKDGKESKSNDDKEDAKQAKEVKKEKEPSATDNQAVKQPCILIFDSLTTGSHARVAATLREYLTCEYKAKMGGEEKREFTADNMKGCCPRVPQQPNFSDCGLYLLQYAESFFEAPVKDFALPLTGLKRWFPRKMMRQKREKIAGIIQGLHKKQYPNRSAPLLELAFTPESGAGYSSEEEDDEEERKAKAAATVAAMVVPPSASKKGEKGKNKVAVKTISLSTKGPGAAAAVQAAEKGTDSEADSGKTTKAVKAIVITTSAAQKVIVPSIMKSKQPSPSEEKEEKKAENKTEKKEDKKEEDDASNQQPVLSKKAAEAAAAAGGGMVIVKKKGAIYVDSVNSTGAAASNKKAAKREGSSSPPMTNGVAAASPSPAAPSAELKEKKKAPEATAATAADPVMRDKDSGEEIRSQPAAVMSKLDAAFGAAFRRSSTASSPASSSEEVKSPAPAAPAAAAMTASSTPPASSTPEPEQKEEEGVSRSTESPPPITEKEESVGADGDGPSAKRAKLCEGEEDVPIPYNDSIDAGGDKGSSTSPVDAAEAEVPTEPEATNEVAAKEEKLRQEVTPAASEKEQAAAASPSVPSPPHLHPEMSEAVSSTTE